MKSVVMILFLMVSQFAWSQRNYVDYQCLFEQAYLTGNQKDWPALIAEMSALKNDQINWQLTLALARYGYIGMLIEQKKKPEASAVIDQLHQQLETICAAYPRNTQAMSMKAGLFGYRIGISPWKAPVLGPMFGRNIRQAVNINPNCPYVMMEQANALFYRPSWFGGDKKEAVKMWLKADRLLAVLKKDGCNWYAVHVKVMLLKAYETMGNSVMTAQMRDAIRAEYPNLKWLNKNK